MKVQQVGGSSKSSKRKKRKTGPSTVNTAIPASTSSDDQSTSSTDSNNVANVRPPVTSMDTSNQSPDSTDRAATAHNTDETVNTEAMDHNQDTDSETDEALDTDKTLTIFQLGSAPMLRLNLQVNTRNTIAVVDTGAEVTIISDRVYQSLEPQPPVKRRATMHGAGREMRMDTFVTGPVNIKIGKRIYSSDVYVAPIDDDMLLGLDFLHKHCVILDCRKDVFFINGEALPVHHGKANQVPTVARVMIQHRTVIPPNSAVHVNGILDQKLQDYVVEPADDIPVMMPRCMYSEQLNPRLCLVNPSDRYFTIRKSTVVGEAVRADIAEPMQDNPTHVAQQTVQEQKDTLPEQLEALYDKSGTDLHELQKEKLRSLMHDFQDIFARDEFDLGQFTDIEHSIDTGTASPIKQRMRRTPMVFAQEEESHLKTMLEAGIIEPSISEWASPPVLIRKRDGKVRWCIDYRKLNAVTKKDVYPLPLIEECIDTLSGNEWYSKLDANSAYYQIKVKDSDKDKTAFITKYGLFQFTRMSFGLCNAPSTYARVMNLVLRGLTWNIVLAFLDDILVMGKSFDDHLSNLRTVFERFRQHGLKLKPRKCELFQTEVEFLGRKIDKTGMAIGDEYVKTVKDWPTPRTTKEVERFLGFANYHRTFIKGYAQIDTPLHHLTGKKPYVWGPEQQSAFDTLKTALTCTPVLALPNSKDLFILDTDASDFAIGAELIQVQEGQERVIAYGSFSLAPEQRRYCTTRKELLAVVRFTKQFQHYLLGREFIVRTDHNSLSWLLNFKEPQGQLARWLEVLSQYNMVVKHRPGKKHINADALSRLPDDKPCPSMRLTVDPTDLPCGGCTYCTKVHRNWSAFAQDIDDAVPLTADQRQPSTVAIDEAYAALATLFNPTDSMGHTYIDLIITDDDILIETSVQAEPRVKATGRETTFAGLEYSAEDLIKFQDQDPDLELILYFLRNKEDPSEDTIFRCGPAAKKYWVNREMFFLDEEGILRNLAKKDGHTRLVVPKNLVEEVLSMCHDLPVMGHQGMDRTYGRVKEKYYWYQMNQSTRQFISSCSTCNKHKKANRKAKCPMTKYHAGAPMERVHLDFLGPLPESTTGNSNILVMVDQFTKWVECVPLPSQTAEVTARAAVNEFFARFGFPFHVFTDQGRNFESRLFKAICEVLQIHKSRTTPYRPSANGQVERFNRTLMDAVRCFVDKSQTNWDEHLSQLAGAIRSSVNRSTGFTPNKLMLGREVNLPADLVFRPPDEQNDGDMDDYVFRLQQAIRTSHEIARDVLKTTQSRMKRDYDVKIRSREYKPGDLVYVLDTAKIKGRAKKLDPPWKGPGIVVERLSSYIYKIKLQSIAFITNHDRLKPCLDRKIPAWLRQCQHRLAAGEDILKTDGSQTYCICRKPDDGKFMIQCDECDDWFHGACVGMTKQLADTLATYSCPRCQSPTKK